MRRFWQNNNTIQEENGELWNKSTKLQQSLAELDCEDAIINDKQTHGRVRTTMMRILRAKYGQEIADRTLNRVNKRMQKGHFKNSFNH